MNLYHNCVVINITQILGNGSIVGLYICYHNCSYIPKFYTVYFLWCIIICISVGDV